MKQKKIEIKIERRRPKKIENKKKEMETKIERRRPEKVENAEKGDGDKDRKKDQE